MLAYLFWHRPRDPSAREAYEQAQLAFHRSLARTPPMGMHGSALFRVAGLPWLAPAPDAGPEHLDAGAEHDAGVEHDAGALGYEDWYLLDDYGALGVLGEAAVGRGHRTAHDEAASGFGAGAGGLYGLIEGDRSQIGQRADLLGGASLAVWVERPPGSPRRALGELLGDGMDPRHASLWRRRLVLGPAPEFCVLGREPPAGVALTRLPAGWKATRLEREALWSG